MHSAPTTFRIAIGAVHSSALQLETDQFLTFCQLYKPSIRMEARQPYNMHEINIGKQLTGIDMLATGTEAVICGREVLRIVSIRGGMLQEVHNLRGSRKRENQ